MAFTLTDPRAQSQYRQGLGFGGGVGQQLERNFESERLQKALGAITPNMPMNEVLKQLAMNRVSPENINTYLSPVVQQRLGNQNAAQLIGEAQQKFQSGQIGFPEFSSLLMQANAASGNPLDTRMILDMVRGMQYGNGQQGNTQGQAQGIPQQMGQSLGNNVLQGQGMPFAGQLEPGQVPAYRGRGEVGREQTKKEPTIPRMTQQDRKNIRAEKVNQYGIELGTQLANAELADRDAAYQQEVDEIDSQNTAQQAELAEQAKLRTFVDKKLNAQGFKNADWMGDLVTQEAFKIPGNDEKRWNAVNQKYIQPVIRKLDKMENDNKVPFATMKSPQKQAAFKVFRNDYEELKKIVPEEYQKQMTEKVRTILRNRNGMGLVSTELALKEPNAKTLAKVSKLGEAPNPELLPPNLRAENKNFYDKKFTEASDKLSDVLFDIAGKEESLLPIKYAVVKELGYPDEVWNQALQKAEDRMRKSGKNWSGFQDQSVQDSVLQMNPSWLDKFRGTSAIPLSGISQ